MPASAREGDAVDTGHLCDGTTVLDAPSQGTVTIEGALACRATDLTVSHAVPPVCAPHTAPIHAGSGTVTIVGLAAARVGDPCDDGSITGGAGTVTIGG